LLAGVDLSDPIDVYTDWIDACEAVNQPDQADDEPDIGNARRREDVGRGNGGGGGGGDVDAEGEEEDDDDDLPSARDLLAGR
jgi:transcription elongation factor Elf1